MNIIHDVHLRHLRMLQALQDMRSVSGAAARLGVTQPAVSHQLRELESRLGTPVCTRSGRTLVLTAAGTRLIAAAGAIFAELREAEQEIARLRSGDAGLLRISAQCHTGYHWLPPLLRHFAARHPHVRVELAVQHTRDPVAALFDGELDLALMTSAIRDRRLEITSLPADEHVAIVAPDHPHARRRFITPAELGAEDLLLYSPSAMESFTVRQILAPAGVHPSRVRYVQLTEAILEMVKAGLGVTVMPRWSVAAALSTGQLRSVRITRAGIWRPWQAATVRSHGTPAYVSDFIALVETTIRARPKSTYPSSTTGTGLHRSRPATDRAKAGTSP